MAGRIKMNRELVTRLCKEKKWNIRQIAKKCDVSVETVRAYLKKHPELPRPKRCMKWDPEEANALLNEGKSLRQTADLCGISFNQLYSYRRSHREQFTGRAAIRKWTRRKRR